MIFVGFASWFKNTCRLIAALRVGNPLFYFDWCLPIDRAAASDSFPPNGVLLIRKQKRYP